MTEQVSKHPLYRVWSAMRARCHSINHPSYEGYGSRGIRVCDEWRMSSRVFIAWAIKAGWRPGLQIDRKDNDGPYAPHNCRWVTPLENNLNKPNTIRLSDGRAAVPVARSNGISKTVLHNRLRFGWSPDEAVLVPVSRSGRVRGYYLSDGRRLIDAALANGIPVKTAQARCRLGWCPDDAATIPVHGKRPCKSKRLSKPASLSLPPAPDLPRPVYDPGYPAAYLTKGIEND